MNREEINYMESYEAPRVEVVEVQIECGFALSGNISGQAVNEDMSGGGSIGVSW